MKNELFSFENSALGNNVGFYLNVWGLKPCETQRVHMTKPVVMTATKPGSKPRATVRPYEMSVSFSVRGLQVIRPAADNAVIMRDPCERTGVAV